MLYENNPELLQRQLNPRLQWRKYKMDLTNILVLESKGVHKEKWGHVKWTRNQIERFLTGLTGYNLNIKIEIEIVE